MSKNPVKTIIWHQLDHFMIYRDVFTLPIGSEVEFDEKLYKVVRIKFVESFFNNVDEKLPAIVHVVEPVTP